MEKKSTFSRESKVSKGILAVGIVILLIFSILVVGCEQGKNSNRLSGEVKIDGSSTVFPITEAVAEEFQRENPNVRVTVGVSGTGGGFEKFVRGETDINNASRPIKESEKRECEKNKIDYIELKIGLDGITVVVNPENDWCEKLTVEELRRIWEPGSRVGKWSDIRSEWPDKKIFLLGPDTDSGTFDFFTEVITGEEGKSRSDYTASADDNVLVEGVAGEKYGLGYFGFAYYEENKDKLKAVKINGVSPNMSSINSGEYPLSRPLFIYVNKDSLQKPQVFAFVKLYLENADKIIPEVGYTPLSKKDYQREIKILEDAKR